MPEQRMPKPALTTEREYRQLFTEVAYWRDYVRAICQDHGLACTHIEATLPGSYPVFLVDDTRVIKLFGELFGGARGYAVESRVYALFGEGTQLPVPRLLATGKLYPADSTWQWPYLIMTRVPGVSLGAVFARLTLDDKLRLAQQVGGLVRRLHATALPREGLLRAAWAPFQSFVGQQYRSCGASHREWATLPTHMLLELQDYVLPPEELIDVHQAPCLLHADITEDHLLGDLDGGWRLNGLIDFGDARVGDPFYELVALHLGAFCRDKRMLRAFCESYGLAEAFEPAFVRRAMSYTLLHEFDVLAPTVRDTPAASLGGLDELARRLWDLSDPSSL